MPNKSDSAGKINQYYTTFYLKESSDEIITKSPLDSKEKRDIHLGELNKNEINSLKKIGKLSASCIIDLVKDTIVFVEDIGVSSGAVGINVTDDLEVTTKNKGKIGFSLKCSKNLSQILAKNMGAKSLLLEYFSAIKEQVDFNNKMDALNLIFLNAVLDTTFDKISLAKKEIKKNVKEKGLTKARFTDDCYKHMSEHRNLFLNELRDTLFGSILELNNSQIANACNLILDTGKHHILAEYRSQKEKIEYININPMTKEDIQSVNKRGNDSVTITTNDYIIGFRFKFESGITSSIKLVGDYKKY